MLVSCSKGKGRVIPRKRTGSAHPNAPVRLASKPQINLEQGELPDDPPPRFQEHSVSGGWVERISPKTSQQSEFDAGRKIRESEPVILCDTKLVESQSEAWNAEHLGKKASESEKVPVLCSDHRKNRFFRCDVRKNAYGSGYHVREPKTQQMQMAMTEFIDCSTAWKKWTLYMEAPVLGNNFEAINGVGRWLMDQQLIDVEWMESLCADQKWPSVDHVSLDILSKNGLLPASYECHDRLIAQVSGRRRILLFNPRDAFEGIYPFPLHHPYDRYSMVDFEQIDEQMWPNFHKVKGAQCILQPGEVLFVPQFWFAHSQSLDDFNTSLTFHFDPCSRLRAEDCILLQVSRLLEQRVGEQEGIESMRKWLLEIADRSESKRIDLGTVQGYKQIQMCMMVRDEIELNLEGSNWQELLRKICDDRLLPTPWLNKDFREPLYLHDKPIWREDTRTEEQIKYPELFRHKLEGRA
ncbi:hypothetical protein BSKO_02253 [Bryopsis sp. KO-2023]|nr:hypothetical protein BSKO_02253 [Bryopsis sp. KO-2023]